MPAGTLRITCTICASVDSQGKHGGQCHFGCYGIARYLEWNALTRKLVIKHHALLPYLSRYRTFDELKSFCGKLSHSLGDSRALSVKRR